MNEAIRKRIEETIHSDEIVLFMKGRRRLPQCGFSAQVVSILDQVVDDYTTFNVLDDPEVRQGIKDFSDWPTIPQLYIRGKFVGGCDIITQMYETGALFQELGKAPPSVETPDVTVTETAVAAFKEALADAPDAFVRLSIDQAWRPGLDLGPAQPGDVRTESNGLTLVMDRGSAQRANGVRIDFVAGGSGGFKIDNPNEPPRVRTMTVQDLKARMDASEAFQLVDVRTEQERATAHIEGARLLDDALKDELEAMDKTTTLVFHCHHGSRSQNAAQYFLNQGFTRVYNVVGGIDAWAREVDPSMPRY